MIEQRFKDLVQILNRSNLFLIPFLLKYTLCNYWTPLYSVTVCMFVQNLHNKHTGNPMEYNYDVMEYNVKHGQCLMTFINISEFHF